MATEEQIAAHKRKMMGKHMRRFETGVTRTEQLLAQGKRPRPNMSDATLAAHIKKDS